MFKFPIIPSQRDRQNTRRPQPRRQPRVELLEGRQLLSGVTVTPAIIGNHIGMEAVPAIVGEHVGS